MNNINNFSTESILNYHLLPIPNTNKENINVKYTSYQDLPEFQSNVQLLPFLRNISVPILEPSTCWINTLNAITELRRVRKYFPELFEHFFNIMINPLSEMLIQSNTAISRNILKLTSEIFNYHNYNNSFSDWMSILLPKVLIKSISEIKIIEEEANQVLENLIHNIFYPETIEILLENVNNKNSNISNKSFDYLMKLFSNFDSYSFVNISECIDWEKFFYSLLDLFEIKKEIFVLKSFKILDYLEEIFRNFEGDGQCDILGRILSQIENLEFHSKFEEFIKARVEFNNMKYKKRERYGNMNSTRHSIKSDKRKSGECLNHFWSDGVIDENRNYKQSTMGKIKYHPNQNNFYDTKGRNFGKENLICQNRVYFENNIN